MLLTLSPTQPPPYAVPRRKTFPTTSVRMHAAPARCPRLKSRTAPRVTAPTRGWICEIILHAARDTVYECRRLLAKGRGDTAGSAARSALSRRLWINFEKPLNRLNCVMWKKRAHTTRTTTNYVTYDDCQTTSVDLTPMTIITECVKVFNKPPHTFILFHFIFIFVSHLFIYSFSITRSTHSSSASKNHDRCTIIIVFLVRIF